MHDLDTRSADLSALSPADYIALAESAYRSRDIDRMLTLFEPDAVFCWNGEAVAQGCDALRAWLTDFFGALETFDIRMALRLRQNNLYAVEWHHRRTDREGRVFDGFAGEMIWMSPCGRTARCHQYCEERLAAPGTPPMLPPGPLEFGAPLS